MSDVTICKTCFCCGRGMIPINGEFICEDCLSLTEARDELIRLTERLSAWESVVGKIVEPKEALADATPCCEAWMEYSSQRQWEMYRWRVEELERSNLLLQAATEVAFGEALTEEQVPHSAISDQAIRSAYELLDCHHEQTEQRLAAAEARDDELEASVNILQSRNASLTARLAEAEARNKLLKQVDDDNTKGFIQEVCAHAETMKQLAAAEAEIAKRRCASCGGLLLNMDADKLCQCRLPTVTSMTLPMIADGCFTGDTITIEVTDEGDRK